MLRALLLLSTLFSFRLSIAQNAYSVKGTFKNPFQGNVYLIRGGEKDSAVVHDRSFSFQGETLLPTFSYITIKSSKSIGLVPFYIGDGDIVMELDTLTKTGERKSGKFEVLNIQTRFLQQGNTDRLIDSVSKLITARTKHISDKEAKAGEIRKIITEFLKPNPVSVAQAAILQRNSGYFDKKTLLTLYQSFSEALKASGEGVQIKGATVNILPVVLGEILPEFSQAQHNGDNFSLSSKRGRYVLIDFWASWCVPCREENPVVVRAYNKFKKRGLEIVGVSLDSKRENWLKAIKVDKLPWVHVSDLNGWDNEVSRMFGVRSIPDNILLDQQGKVLARSLRGRELEKKLSEIFR